MNSDAEIVEYSEGVCSDGAAILRNGVPISIPDILSALEDRDRLSARVEELERSLTECLGFVADYEQEHESNRALAIYFRARSLLTPSKMKE